MSETKPKGKRGGARVGTGGPQPGSGRPSNKAKLAKEDPAILATLEAPPSVDGVLLARRTLEQELTTDAPSQARVSAAKAILDRAEGRPRPGLDPDQRRMLQLQIREAELRIRLLEQQAEGRGLALGEDQYDPLREP